jgi:VWFA-related protein
MFPRTAAFALLVASSLYARSQEPAADVQTLKLSTRIVVLDVVVTDKKGNVVTTGLGKDDFTIVEDKVPQTIRSFDAPAAHAMPAGVVVNSAADLKKIGDAPVTLLVLDELNTRFEDMAYSRNAMVKYLEAQPAVLKQPAVLLIATNTKFAQMHDYTQDRDALIFQIKHHMPEYPSKMMTGGRGGPAAVERMAQSLAALEQLAKASTGTPGRKNVIWVGNGFPSADLVGLDNKTADTITSAIKNCTDLLLAARITMYTINPTLNSTVTLDVETPEDLTMAETENGGEPYSGSVQFSTFAPATGGRAFLSRNDIDNEIAEGIAQGNSYYTLSYAPTNRSDDAQKYRDIVIVMKDKNLRATTRNGYYPPSSTGENIALTEPPKQAKAQLQMELSNAVTSAISYNGLDLKATRVGDNYVVSVKGKGLSWSPLDPGREKSEVSIIAAWYTDKNKLLGHTGRELTATRTAASDAQNPDPQNGADGNFVMPAPSTAGAARLRFVVRDATNGNIGTVDLKP